MKNRGFLAPGFFLALLCMSIGFTIGSFSQLPPTVAVHFDAAGAADSWMTAASYSSLILFLMIVVPVLLILLFAVLPRVTGGRGQIPNSDYWLVPERAQDSLGFLFRHSCWLASMTLATLYGINLFILRANGVTPPRLDTERLFLMVFVYLAGLAWWSMTLFRRFSRH